MIFNKTIYYSPENLVQIKNIYFLGVACSSLVKLIQRMDKPRQKYKTTQ